MNASSFDITPLKVLSFIVFSCVFNQSKDHWLLSDVLNSSISICWKLRKEFGKSSSFDNFIEEEYIVVFELVFWAINIKKNLMFEIFF
jgi:hypothetical protein